MLSVLQAVPAQPLPGQGLDDSSLPKGCATVDGLDFEKDPVPFNQDKVDSYV